MAQIVIADASPLIALARVNGLGWLQQLFTGVVVTEIVLAEVLTGRYPHTEAPIQQALAAGWLQATDFRMAPAVIQAVLERCGE
ncbi:MAG: hypothetical protein ACKO8I_05180 [Cyanobacteriota bacterium]